MNMHSYHSYKRCACNSSGKTKAEKLNADIARQLKIAGVPSKLGVLLFLEQSPHCVCDLAQHTKLSQTLVSHHLADLADTGLVQNKKNGAFVDYSLTPKGRKLTRAVKTLES